MLFPFVDSYFKMVKTFEKVPVLKLSKEYNASIIALGRAHRCQIIGPGEHILLQYNQYFTAISMSDNSFINLL